MFLTLDCSRVATCVKSKLKTDRNYSANRIQFFNTTFSDQNQSLQVGYTT